MQCFAELIGAHCVYDTSISLNSGAGQSAVGRIVLRQPIFKEKKNLYRMCPFVRPSVICSFHSFVRGCRCPLDIISPYWPPSCCGWTPRVTEGSDQRHERAQGPRGASRVQRASLPWWGGGFEAQDPFRHDRYSPQHAERGQSTGCVDQRACVCFSEDVVTMKLRVKTQNAYIPDFE